MKRSLIAATFLILVLLASCNFPSASNPSSGFPPATLPATVEPLPMASEFLTGVTFVAYDPFDNLRQWTYRAETGALSDGTFELTGAPRWQGSFWPKRQFIEGQGLATRFKVKKANAQSELVFVTGEWQTDTFRQFGVYNAVIPKGDLFLGRKDLGGYDLKSNFNIHSDTWYDLLMAIGPNGHFLAVVWDPSDPAHRAVHDVAGGPDWAGRKWVFLPKANEGETVFIDDFYRISFTDIK